MEWLEKEVCPLKPSCEVDTSACFWTQASHPEAPGSKFLQNFGTNRIQNTTTKEIILQKENVSFVAEIVIAEICSGCFISRPYQFAVYFVN